MSSATLTIDLNNLATNWRALDQMSDVAVETGAVVKADGYGLGAERVAQKLIQSGVRRFFVATAEEGAHLRSSLGPTPEINVLSGHMSGDTDMTHDMHLTPMLNSIAQLTRHLEALPGHSFGIQLDTGMNRLGMEPGEWAAVRDLVMAAKPTLLMSHLACSDQPDHPMNAQQLAVFQNLTDGLPVARSLAATGGILLGPDYHFDLVRPGIGLYGGEPYSQALPVIRLQLPVVQTRSLEIGETVGYSNAWTAQEPRQIATLTAGYADGIARRSSDVVSLYFGDVACPVIGRVSMDLITVDISDLGEIPEYLDIICDAQPIDIIAKQIDTIGYEILTTLGPRYLRRYIGSVT